MLLHFQLILVQYLHRSVCVEHKQPDLAYDLDMPNDSKNLPQRHLRQAATMPNTGANNHRQS